MANSDKDIVITPNKGSSVSDPQIVFSGADASTGPQNITLKILPSNSGTLSIEGSAGQLLSVTNSLTGVIFSVNDVSGIPSIEVNSSGLIKFAQYSGNVVIGGASEISSGKLSVYAGGASAVSWGTGFNLGSAANYTSQIQDNSIARWRNVGAGGYQWYNGAGTDIRMTLSNTGNLTISGEIVATRLVDANDNNFFVDPAGTSVLNIVNILGGTTRDTFGPERRYYIGNLTASATQARQYEIARVYIDFNDWHAAGTIFVELQNYYYFGGDTQIWSISYDYNNVNCDLMWGNSPRGRLARVRAGSPTQTPGLTGDFYYIPIYVDVRYYGQYYTYLRTSWPEVSAHANSISGGILVYTSPSGSDLTPDFTVSTNIFTNNNIHTSGQMHADLFQEYNDTGRFLNPAGDSVLGKITINDGSTTGGLIVNGATYAVVAVNRANVTDGEAAYLWRTTNVTRWNNRLAINDNNILRWQNAAGTDVLTLSQTGALIASAEMQAPIFYDKDDTTYYVEPAAGHPNAPGTSALLRGHILQQTLLSRPYVVWGASGTSTGQVVIRLPGTIANYGMVHAVIDIYEYNGNNVATAIIGGHNWNNGIWYNFGCNLIGYTDKQIRLGVIGNQFCISIGTNGSTWSYGQVVLRKIQNGSYYSGVMNLGGTYTISQDNNAEASYTYISGDLRQLRSAGSFTTTGYIYGARFVDYDNNSYYVDPASGSVLAGSITKDGRTVPWVAMQDAAPTATQTGDLWWESDTGRMKLWYNDGNSSQWVDSHPIPDLTGYLKTIGGSLTGPLVSSSYISAEGYIHSNTSIRSERYTDAAGNFLFRVARNSGVNRIINLADTNSDPSSVGNSVNGISWGQRGDNSPYYLIYVRNGENYNGNYSKLTIAWHTGIHIGADPYYGGTNFYSQSPGVGGSLIFSVGRGDSNVRVTNDIYAKSFIDIDSTSWLVNPASDRTTNIYGFSNFTVEGATGTYKYNTPRWAHTTDQNYWVGSMGWGTNNLDSVFDWGSGFADSWGSPGGAPGDTSHYVIAQAVHYTNGTNRYGWQLAGGVTDSFWWRKTWNGFSAWYRIAMYGNNNSTGWLYAGRFVDSDNTAFWADPASISNMYLIQGKLYTNTSDYAASDSAPIKTWTGVLCAGSDYYGAQPYTFVRTKVRYDTYMMGGFTIDWYENYSSTNAKTQICLGGYWNPPSNGGMQGFEYTSTNPNIRPTIVVGYDAQGYTVFRLSHYSSNYVQIVVRDLYLGYSGGDQNMGDSNWQGLANGWQLIQSGDANYNSFAGQVTVQPRLAVAMDSVSMMTAAIGRGSHMGGFLQGSYNSVGDNAPFTNPIYTIGSNYNPAQSSLQNMYGIGYTLAGGQVPISHSLGWGMYVAADGDVRVWLDGSNGDVIGRGYFFADAFYDYYNTSYYMNPQSTTQLRTVYADDWFRPQGTTGIYWQNWDTRIYSDTTNWIRTRSDFGWHYQDRSANSKGYVHHDSSNNFGLLNYLQNWQVRVNNGYQELYGETYTNTNYGRVYYWRDDTYFRLWLTAESRMNQIRMTNGSNPFYFSGTGEQSFVRDGASQSVTFNLQESGTTTDSSDYGVLWLTRLNHNNGHNSGANLYFRSKGSNGATYEWAGIGGLQTSAGSYSGRLNFYIYSRNNIAWIDASGMYAPVLYDSTDAFYKFDGNGDTSMAQVYANGWFRNRNSGQGLYNQSTGMHWYSTGAYWHAAGGNYGYGGISVFNNYESDLRGRLYYDSSGFGLLNSTGNWAVRIEPGNNNMELYRITYANDVRAYIYYHRGSEGYYLQPASTSVLWRPDAATQQRWSAPWRAFNDNNVRSIITGDSNYWTTTMGWGTSYGTWATAWRYGFGGFDIWGSGTDHPQGGGYVHAQGIQSGIHYAVGDAQAGYGAYGWQMVGAADAADRWWLRGKWWSTRSWFEIALYNNNNSSGDLYAGRFYDRNTNYYGDFDSQSRLYSLFIQNVIDFPTSNGASSGRGGPYYNIYQESGGWNFPYPDLCIGFHTGISFGANQSYEGMRFFNDANLATLLFQVNGGSEYLYKYRWMYTNGASGFYSDLNGWEIQSNNGNSTYGSMTLRGNRSGWYGLFISTGNSPHLMFDGSGNGGCYSEGYARWMWYHSLSNSCMGVGTSTTNGAYGLYVVKGIYSEGNVVAYSDIRAKENIYTIDNALEKVEKMRGVYFNYKTTPDKKDVGVIAQEMLEAVPEVVDYDKENDKYSVGYGNLTAVLIEAVKELSAEVKRLKKKLGEE